eukprot:994205-Rhodomonas_salina.2
MAIASDERNCRFVLPVGPFAENREALKKSARNPPLYPVPGYPGTGGCDSCNFALYTVAGTGYPGYPGTPVPCVQCTGNRPIVLAVVPTGYIVTRVPPMGSNGSNEPNGDGDICVPSQDWQEYEGVEAGRKHSSNLACHGTTCQACQFRIMLQ